MISPYVYKITDKETGEFYIGYRTSNVRLNRTPEEDFLIHYFSSGVLKEKLIQNINRFEGNIIFKFADADVCYWYEQLLIKENSSNVKCLNGNYLDPDSNTKKFCRSGSSGWNKGKTLSEETRKKMSESQTGRKLSEKSKEKMSMAKRGRTLSQETIEKIRASNIGRVLSQESIEKIRASNTGKKRSKETIEKMSSSMKGKPWSEARRLSQKSRGTLSSAL